MKRFILLLCLLSACATLPKMIPSPQVSPSPAPSASPSPSPVAGPAQDRVQVVAVQDYSTPEERVKIEKASHLMNKVIQSDCFKNFISQRALVQTNGKTAAQVAAHLQSLTGVIHANMYYRRMGFLGTSAVAYRQPPSTDINLNRAYFVVTLDTCEWASTVAHESVGHSLGGYDHDFNATAQRPFSVPYSINAAFDACCKE